MAPRVDVRYVVPLGLPLWLDGPHKDILRALSVSRGQGTVFIVSAEQWRSLVSVLGGWEGDNSEITDAAAAIAQRAGQLSSSQGFHVSAEERQAIDRYAMAHAEQYFLALDWDGVQNVSARACYDLHCTRSNGDELHVEVKGTQSDGSQILLTRNEVAHAHSQFPNTALYILAELKIDRTGVEVQ